ncbi:MAG: hypothetical protein JWR22_2221 [Herminiimonas sp.]|nr:hypothetical protein [Herminiimonas sp.]
MNSMRNVAPSFVPDARPPDAIYLRAPAVRRMREIWAMGRWLQAAASFEAGLVQRHRFSAAQVCRLHFGVVQQFLWQALGNEAPGFQHIAAVGH